MGQRLNIEIISESKVLANAYYHWSAYTETALELTGIVIKAYKETQSSDNYKQRAVWALQATGAGLPEEEKKTISAKNLKGLTECKGRDYGLIAVSDKSIQETRYWEEYRVTLYLDEQRVDFDCLWKRMNYEYDKENKEKISKGELPAFDNLPMIEWNICDIKFNDFKLFEQCIKDLKEEGKDDFRTKQFPCAAYSIIY